MKIENKTIETYLFKKFIRDNWKGFIFLFLIFPIFVAFLFSLATPVVASKEHIGVLELQYSGAVREAHGARRITFYVQLKGERVMVVPPPGAPFREGENVIIFEDIYKSGLRGFRFGGYEKDKKR